jgi:hypothetical protein
MCVDIEQNAPRAPSDAPTSDFPARVGNGRPPPPCSGLSLQRHLGRRRPPGWIKSARKVRLRVRSPLLRIPAPGLQVPAPLLQVRFPRLRHSPARLRSRSRLLRVREPRLRVRSTLLRPHDASRARGGPNERVFPEDEPVAPSEECAPARPTPLFPRRQIGRAGARPSGARRSPSP